MIWGLGDLTFDIFQCPELKLTEPHLFTETRPAVLNFLSWQIGEWGDPFPARTLTTFETRAEAQTYKATLLAKKGAGGLALTLNNTNIAAGYTFKVLEVMPSYSVATVTTTGKNHIITAQWQLAALAPTS